MLEQSTDRTEWLGKKVRRIGSSDARAIFGCGYEGESELTVWERMVHGIRPSRTAADIDLMNEGNVMEPAIIKMFSTKNDEWEVEKTRGFDLIVNPEYPDLCCTLDAIATHKVTGKKVVVEAKNEQNGNWYDYKDDDGNETVPVKHLVQVQHQLICTGWEGGYLVALVRGRYVQRWIPRNEELISEMIKTYARFMNDVRTQTRPNVDGAIVYQSAYANAKKEEAKYVGKAVSDAVREAVQIQIQIDKAQQRLSQLKKQIVDGAKGCAYLVLDDEQKVKLQKSSIAVVRRLPKHVRLTA